MNLNYDTCILVFKYVVIIPQKTNATFINLFAFQWCLMILLVPHLSFSQYYKSKLFFKHAQRGDGSVSFWSIFCYEVFHI